MKKRIITLILVFVLAITTTVTVFADTVGNVVTDVQTDETYTNEEGVTEDTTAEVPAEAADEETTPDEETTADEDTFIDEETTADEDATPDEETVADEGTSPEEETASETSDDGDYVSTVQGATESIITKEIKYLIGTIEKTVEAVIWATDKSQAVTLSGVYYFGEDMELPPIEVGDGGLTMIIGDGVTITIDARKYDEQGRYAGIISEDPDNPLVIMAGRPDGDSQHVEGTGKLVVYGGYQSAAIGGCAQKVGGYVTIEGCTIYAYGGDGDRTDRGSSGAGIGGGAQKKGEDITINGGTVYAYGGNRSAGIGSGGECYTDAEDIEINGGTVYAYGDQSGMESGGGAGIGGGAEGGASDITINGGTVYAYGAGTSAGIGSGTHFAGDVQGHDITINGGTVRAYGSSKAEDKGGAGIGSAYGHKAYNITINGGDVEAYGYGGAAGIGGGGGVSGSTYATENIKITGGTVKAVSVKESGSSGKGAGIGSGAYSNAKEILITGGTITAISEYEGAGIGSGSQGNLKEGEYGIKITGGNITAESIDGGAGIGAGYKGDAKAIEISGDDTVINATANNGAGIGGGSHANAKNITIEGGTIVATSRGLGAGIGSGWGGQTAKEISITGGCIEAYGGGSGNTWGEGCGCGIGVGYFDSNKTEPNDEITIKTSLEAKYLKNGTWYDLANNGDDLAHYGDANFMKWRVVKIDNAEDKSIVIGPQKNIQEYGTADTAEYDLTTSYISGDDWTVQWYKGDTALDDFDAEVTVENGAVFVYYSGYENAGTYSFTLSCDGVTSNKAEFIIAKRSASITSGSATKVYDGTPLTCEFYEASGFADGEGVIVTCTGSQTTVGTSKNTFTKSAKSGTNLDNYSIEENEGTLEVVEQPFVITGQDYYETYDGYNHELEVSIIGRNGVDYTDKATIIYYTSSTGSDWALTGNGGKDKPSIKDAGTVYVKVEAQYQGKPANPIKAYYTMTVTPRYVLLISASADKEYDGTALTKNNPDDDISVSGGGFLNDTEKSAYTITFKSTSTQTKVGSTDNEFTCTFTDNTKAKAGNYTIDTEFGQLVVTPKSIPVTIITPSNSKLYDGSYINAGTATSNFDAVKATGDTLTVELNHNHAKGTEANDFEGRVKDAGTYNNDIESYKVENGAGEDVTNCYTFAEPEIGVLTIEKRQITLASGSDLKVKTQAGDYAENKNIIESGDGLIAGEKLAYTGFQKVTEVSYTPTDNTFEYAAASGSAFKAENYDITVETGYLMLVEEMSIVGKDATFTYDGDSHEVPVTVVDNGQGAEVVVKYSTSTDNKTWSEYTNTVPSLKDAGTLYVKARATKGVQEKDASYKITVNKRELTVLSGSAEKQYDGTALTCNTYTISGDGFAKNEGIDKFTATGTQTDVGESQNIYTYTLKSNTKAANYVITELKGTLKVTRVELPVIIESESDSWVYNGMPLSCTDYSATWGGADVKDTPLYGTDYLVVIPTATITDVGSVKNEFTYQVLRNGKDVTDNYTFECVEGTLEVTQRSVIVNVSSAEKTYDGTPLTSDNYNILGDGFISGEGFESVTIVGTRTNAGEADNALGGYTLKAGTKENNYNIISYPGTLTVNKRKVTVSSGSAVTVDPVDAVNSNVTVSGDGFVSGEVTLTATGIQTETTTDKTNPKIAENTVNYVWAGNGNPANYVITENLGKLVKLASNIAYVAVEDYVCMYDGNGHNSEVTLPSGATVSYTINGAAVLAGTDPASLMVDAGVYTVEISAGFNNDTATCQYTVTINRRELTLTAESAEKVYDGSPLSAGYIIGGDGFANETEKADAAQFITTTGTITNVGTVTNGITYPTETKGTFKPANYIINQYPQGQPNPYEGTLTVTERPVILISKSFGLTPKNTETTSEPDALESALLASAYEYAELSGSIMGEVLYTGEAQSIKEVVEVGNPDHGGLKEIEGMGFVGDDGVTFSDFSEITDAGLTRNEFTYAKKGSTDLDNYSIKVIYGVMKISQREVILTSDSASKMYDGTALTAKNVTASGDGFVSGEGLVSYDIATGSQKNVGISYNPFEYTLKDNTDPANYDITCVEGTLEVYDNNTLRLVSPGDQTYTYDGKAHGKPAKAYIGDTELSAEEVLYSVDGGKTFTNTTSEVATEVGKVQVIAKVVKRGYEEKTVTYTIEIISKVDTGDHSSTTLWIILAIAAVIALAAAAVMFFRRRKSR